MRYFFQKVVFLVFLLFFGATAFAEGAIKCSGYYKGQQLSRDQIIKLLDRQTGPLNLCGADLHGINLSGLDLRGVDLQGANLLDATLRNTNLSDSKLEKIYFRSADLTDANLQHANLTSASLESATLDGANLRLTILSNANLVYANLSNSDLQSADLIDTKLTDVNLTKANLQWANLTKANLSGSNLTSTILADTLLINANLSNTLMHKTVFSQANLQGATFEPKLKYLPDLLSLSTAQHFKTIIFDVKQGAPSLLMIRSGAKKAGLLTMQKTITAIVKTAQMKAAWHRGGWGYVESAFNFVLFYLTCDFGASPGRAFLIFFTLILIFALPYYVALSLPRLKAGIIVLWEPRKNQMTRKFGVIKHKPLYRKILKITSYPSWWKKLRQQWWLIRICLYFSWLNAFSIGWHELNARNWMRNMQTRDYNLRGYSWARVLSGIQPVLSIYLLVLWAVTYFGHPFDW